MPKTATHAIGPEPDPKDATKAAAGPKMSHASRVKRALALTAQIPDPPGSEAKWRAVERGIAEARHPRKKT